jgi:hypothetical protein
VWKTGWHFLDKKWITRRVLGHSDKNVSQTPNFVFFVENALFHKIRWKRLICQSFPSARQIFVVLLLKMSVFNKGNNAQKS